MSNGSVRVLKLEDAPSIRHRSIVTTSTVWKDLLAVLRGKPVLLEVSAGDWPELRDPQMALLQAVRRHVSRNKLPYRVYTGKGKIYLRRTNALEKL